MKLNIHEILGKLDNNNFDTYREIGVTDEARAEFDKNISWMIPQWFTGAVNPVDHRNMVVMFDQACNPGWGALYYHPELQAKLLAAIGYRGVRHKFYRPSGKRKSSIKKLFDLLQLVYEDIHEDEVVLWCRSSTINDLEDLLDRAGIPLEYRKDYCKQFKTIQK